MKLKKGEKDLFPVQVELVSIMAEVAMGRIIITLRGKTMGTRESDLVDTFFVIKILHGY